MEEKVSRARAVVVVGDPADNHEYVEKQPWPSIWGRHLRGINEQRDEPINPPWILIQEPCVVHYHKERSMERLREHKCGLERTAGKEGFYAPFWLSPSGELGRKHKAKAGKDLLTAFGPTNTVRPDLEL